VTVLITPVRPAPPAACCATCDAYLAEGPSQGYCRAAPPQAFLVGVNQAIAGGPIAPVLHGSFPPVPAGGWCRSHRPRDNPGA
jgi:hypothetical protein